jgi:hypothetical protein
MARAGTRSGSGPPAHEGRLLAGRAQGAAGPARGFERLGRPGTLRSSDPRATEPESRESESRAVQVVEPGRPPSRPPSGRLGQHRRARRLEPGRTASTRNGPGRGLAGLGARAGPGMGPRSGGRLQLEVPAALPGGRLTLTRKGSCRQSVQVAGRPSRAAAAAGSPRLLLAVRSSCRPARGFSAPPGPASGPT